MEEGSFCLIGAAYPGSGAPMDKSRIPRKKKSAVQPAGTSIAGEYYANVIHYTIKG